MTKFKVGDKVRVDLGIHKDLYGVVTGYDGTWVQVTLDSGISDGWKESAIRLVERASSEVPSYRLPGESDEAMCKRLGWGVGVELIGDEGYVPIVIRIESFEEGRVRARCIEWHGHPVVKSINNWDLSCREWELYSVTPTQDTDIAKLQEELNQAVFYRVECEDNPDLNESLALAVRATTAVLHAGRALQEALQPPEPEQKYLSVFTGAVGHQMYGIDTVETLRILDDEQTLQRVFPLDPVTDVAGAQLSKEELTALLEDK